MFEFVTDESFDLEKTYEYILSIQVCLDGFSFSVVCPTENRLLAFKSTSLKISSNSLIARNFKEWATSEALLQKPFKKIRIVVFSNKYTLIPEQYSNKELKLEIPKILFDENNELEIAENVINKLEARLVFALPAGINRIFTEQFGECEIIHPLKVIANQHSNAEKGLSLLLILDSENIYITLFNKNTVLLSNSFKQAHANDVVYYVLTVLKQLEIEPQTTELLYIGKSEIENDAINVLKKYFYKTDILSATNPIQIDDKIQLQPIHHHFILFN
ncbi:MAG: DUF3822 family protein [Bacteroidetes bacterium]|nr:DUF3822 family protein [Bacteroidota bacterium]